MNIFVKERQLKKPQVFSYTMLFNITVLPYHGESVEKANEKGGRFRDKIDKDKDKLKKGNISVGRFFPMPNNSSYAFFVIECPSFLGIQMKEVMRKSVEDGDSLFLK